MDLYMIHHTDESTSENVCYSYHVPHFKLTAVTANASLRSAPEHAQVQEVTVSGQFAQQNATDSKPPLDRKSLPIRNDVNME